MPTLQTYQGEYLWKYIPNLPAAVVFAILFSILTAMHAHKMITTRQWFCIPFVIGGICEPIGYVSRALAANNTGSLIPLLLQGIFLLLPPVFFAASLYMVYSRIVRAVHGDKYSLVSPRWCTRIFVIGDLVCLNIQSSGAGLLGNPDLVKIGDAIIVAGLGLQIIVFVGFVYCCVSFHRRFNQHSSHSEEQSQVPWTRMLWMLYATSAIISVRNVFRLVEYIMGKDGYLLSNEWPVYVFDGALMLVVMVVFYVWYPSQLLHAGHQSDSMIELASDAGDGQIRGRSK